MDNTKATLSLLESVIGKGEKTAKGNYIFVCPFHISNPPGKKKLEVNIETDENGDNPYHCWACGSKGKTIRSLFKKTGHLKKKKQEVDLLIKPGKKRERVKLEDVRLPDEFIPLDNPDDLKGHQRIMARHALKYLRSRKLKHEDILKYNIGFCCEGFYKDRVIIPSYDDKGKLNYFQARIMSDEMLGKKYQNPPISSKEVIGFELFINWSLPIILCEGSFDALTIKRNVIPLFGKVIHPKLMTKLVNSDVQKIYIALDNDAIKDSLKYCEELMAYGKEVYLVRFNGKDANTIGFERFLEILESTNPVTFNDILREKLKLI